MNIINGFDELDTDKLFCVKASVWLFLSQNNNLQDELTIEESIFASDNETLKVIEASEKALENPEDEKQKLLTEWINTMLGILKHNTSKSFQTKA
jgi:ATP-binding cassette subfamily F protein uup